MLSASLNKIFPSFLCIGVCVLQLGDRLVADKHYASPEIKEVKERLNREWVDLNEKAADKGKKLRDASKQQMLNRALEDAQVNSGHQDSPAMCYNYKTSTRIVLVIFKMGIIL